MKICRVERLLCFGKIAVGGLHKLFEPKDKVILDQIYQWRCPSFGLDNFLLENRSCVGPNSLQFLKLYDFLAS